MTLNQIKAALPIASVDPTEFAPPVGWSQQTVAAPGKPSPSASPYRYPYP